MTKHLDFATVLENPNGFVDELVYLSYAHNRRESPHITPERWAKIFPDAGIIEARFQFEESFNV